MSGSILFLGGLTAIFGVMVALKYPEELKPSLYSAAQQGRELAPRMLLGIFIATILGRVVPVEVIGPLIGPESGGRGLLIAIAFGAITPGGPMISFPIAMKVWDLGAGPGQLVGFIVSWSVFAVHRILSYEWPIMGGKFVVLRLLSTWYLPLIAGGLALALLLVLPVP
jgi:uncharacterized membrane protein YraQ (UPF0718 family)